jgi:hypothetical protein
MSFISIPASRIRHFNVHVLPAQEQVANAPLDSQLQLISSNTRNI